ncbi:LysR family transcriptional regulator [Micromonospora sp. DR5-3]|uniref:LysR family transcriptional regulator n=1 Tax=unclassified Micromonospora TaxID=2617518 RepID=UPI0011D9192C|nr:MULTISPECIES: LysR family transcriptional regulator [unclassified Micromonospora]MCW3817871.1 LysR family transcriptional regulator [Micromonospora sp. DR5-3]TYC22964.1 LysR family transcriptional regulator [Micromonospora sp. MP36]
MLIDDLRKLLSLADHERITDAAAALRTSQPSLSRLLARVEQELGTRLFERDAKGVHPNPYGEMVLAAARDITDRYDLLRRELADLLDPESGTVRLAFLDSMATSLVPRILHDFRRAAPRVRVALRQEPGHEMLHDLATGTAELAITSPRPAGEHGWLPLQRQRLTLVVPRGHRLAARRQVRLDDIADEDFVTVPAGFGFRTQVDELFRAAGVVPRVAFEIGDLATIEGLVGSGLGVALLPEQFAGASNTVGVPATAPGAERVVGLTWRTDRALAPAAARFLAFVRQAGSFD